MGVELGAIPHGKSQMFPPTWDMPAPQYPQGSQAPLFGLLINYALVCSYQDHTAPRVQEHHLIQLQSSPQ